MSQKDIHKQLAVFHLCRLCIRFNGYWPYNPDHHNGEAGNHHVYISRELIRHEEFVKTRAHLDADRVADADDDRNQDR